MRYCPKCGRPLGDGDKVCGYCGTVQQMNRQVQPQQPVKKLSGGILALLVTLSVLVIAAVVIIVVMATRDKAPEAPVMTEVPSWMEEEAEAAAEPEPTSVSEVPYYVTGVADTIKVWESAGSGVVLNKLYTGNEVAVVDASGVDYWQIQLDDGTMGYIDRHYLTEEWDAVMAPETYYVAEAVTVLEEPFATGSREMGELQQGAEVTVLAKPAGSYWYIYADDVRNYGYVPAVSLVVEPDEEKPVGPGSEPSGHTMLYYADSNDGFLSLRSEPTVNSVELGRIRTGDAVWVINNNESLFWYVYAPTLRQYGYVHSDYLRADWDEPSGETWTVRVDSGYLALRTAKAYDYYNEIGKLYTGDTVEVITKEGTYWWVYAPSLGKHGYVNSEYLY